MDLSSSTRVALTENLRIVANAVEASDPGEATGTVELPFRCPDCSMELYGSAIVDHVCAAADLRRAS